MVFAIVGGDGKPTGYEIENSLRFGGGNSYLSRQFSGANTSRKTFTLSCWLKRSELGERAIIGATTTSNFYDNITFSSTDQLDINNVASGSDAISFKTSMKFRDVSAWYHIVFGIDTTQASGSDGIKIYINGVLQTSLATSNYTQNATFEIGRDGSTTNIGRRPSNSDYYNVGYLSDFYYIDGQQKAASDFGETNDNGVWIPKKYDGTYGNNGFKLEFKQTGTSQNSSGIGADTSGQDEHFAVNNLAATDVTTDTPTNNFATLNPLIPVQQVPTYSEGNTKVVFKDGGNGCSPLSTFAVNSGKFYFEAKFVETSVVGRGAIGVGIVDADKYNPYGDADDAFDLESFGYSYTTDGHAKTNNSTSSFGSTYASGDIISVAVDFDNRQIYYSKNGTLQNSGDPTSGASGTGSAHNFSVGTYYFSVYGYQDENSWEMNFGNSPFSISSGNSDSRGYGNFEYAVPSGYYSLCTKNLAEYG